MTSWTTQLTMKCGSHFPVSHSQRKTLNLNSIFVLQLDIWVLNSFWRINHGVFDILCILSKYTIHSSTTRCSVYQSWSSVGVALCPLEHFRGGLYNLFQYALKTHEKEGKVECEGKQRFSKMWKGFPVIPSQLTAPLTSLQVYCKSYCMYTLKVNHPHFHSFSKNPQRQLSWGLLIEYNTSIRHTVLIPTGFVTAACLTRHWVKRTIHHKQ